MLAEKVVKGSASGILSIPSQPNIVAGIVGVGLFTWGAVKLFNEKAEEE